MKKLSILFSILFVYTQLIPAATNKLQNEPDSAYIFAYTTDRNGNREGLHFAWSIDKENWNPIGPEFSYLKSDYGRWGAEKRMYEPFLMADNNGLWHCIWTLNDRDGAISHAVSSDLINWKPQAYPTLMDNGNCLSLETYFDKARNEYVVSWLSGKENQDKQIFYSTTKDFKTYSPTQESNSQIRKEIRQTIEANNKTLNGTIHKVSWEVIDKLINHQNLTAYKNQLHAETTQQDVIRFASLEPVNVTVKIEKDKTKDISDMLVGIFFEDINYAADGGLYAELIQNRDFEYDPADKEGHDKNWNSYTAWSVNNENIQFYIETDSPIHPNNPHYAVLNAQNTGGGLVNEGFDGIAIKKGEKYNFSVFARTPEAKKGKLLIRLIGDNGEIYGEASTKAISSDWKKQEIVITANATVANAKLIVIPQMTGEVHLDMISLFPQNTFKNRKNGLRADLAQVIADIQPRFVRFPGGCVAHGDGLENMYRWKNTIGPLEARKPQRNLWGYHQTAGLGYFEYFQFCEDIGAEPVPVVPAAVPCQNSGTGGAGQQGGIHLSEMDEYIQEVLDLIEYANGDVKTVWGKKRAEAGHPAPFNLKYLGVGNEDLISDIFEERFEMIYNAVKEKHPEIVVIGSVGPFNEGSDYVEGWEFATKIGLPMVDEHYYQTPGWFINNQDYYDKYDRNKAKVYLGEYAAHLPGRLNNLETALAEALWLTTLERNGDVVTMTSYAPLLAKEGHTQWNPDLIYFNNTEVKPTTGYQVQKLFGNHAGDKYIPTKTILSTNNQAVKNRITHSVVKDSATGDIIVKLVNILPVEVNYTMEITDLGNFKPEATKTVLTGKPDGLNLLPQTSAFTVENNLEYSLPPYSFTVIRLNSEN